MRARSVVFIVLVACGRSAVPLEVGEAAAAGSNVRDAGARVRTPACPVPDSPVTLPEGCGEAMCACDREAFSNCGWDCWTKVACQVATCNNNPVRVECPRGCANATEAELSLGQCYEASRACTRR